jgi:DNA-binding response OmpR family regulator
LLVVDDDVVVPMLFAMGLAEVEIIEATRAGEALGIAATERPDAVIVDHTLPDGDGLQLIRSLRALPSAHDLPIVLISAGHDEALRSEVLRAGADDYLPKPVDPTQLEALVRQLRSISPEQMRERRERTARSVPMRAPASEAPTAE